MDIQIKYSVAWKNMHFGVEHGFANPEMASRFIERICKRIDPGITANVESWIPMQEWHE